MTLSIAIALTVLGLSIGAVALWFILSGSGRA
jgi:hypothetical protein